MSENAATTPLELTVSPDFSPEHIAGWYVFNTWLQRRLGERIHLELYEDFAAQRQAIAAERADASFAATSTATSTDIASEQDAALSVQTASSYPQDRHQRLLVVQASH